MLLANGEPLSSADLYHALNKRGLYLHAEKPRTLLTTMFWRTRDRIMKFEDGRYWPVDVPLNTDST